MLVLWFLSNWKNRPSIFRLRMAEGFTVKFFFRYVKFEMPIRLQVEFMSLKFREEYEDINLGVISMQIRCKYTSLNGIS